MARPPRHPIETTFAWWRRRTGIEPAGDAERRPPVLKTGGTTRCPDASATRPYRRVRSGASGDPPGALAGHRRDVPGGVEHVARGARELQVDRRAAVPVRQLDGGTARPRRVLVAPGQQRGDHREQLDPLLGQPVLAARALALLLIRHLAQDALGD